jgi:hypothetical protein
MLLGLVLFGGAGFLIGASLGAAFGTRTRPLVVVLLLAPVAALVFLAWGFAAAPTDSQDCEECMHALGRYWDVLVPFVVATNVVGWWVGALLGAGARALYRRRDSTRPSAA